MELLVIWGVKCSTFFPSRIRDAWLLKSAQRFSCGKVGAKRQSRHWSAGRYPVLCLLCSGYSSMTAHTCIPRLPLTALHSNQPMCSATFLVALALLCALSPSSINSILILVHTRPRDNETFHLFILWDCWNFLFYLSFPPCSLFFFLIISFSILLLYDKPISFHSSSLESNSFSKWRLAFCS